MPTVSRRLLVLVMLAILTLPILRNASADSSRRRAVAPVPPPTAKSFAVDQLEAYLTDDGIAYIRPGLKVMINSISITPDRKFVVDFNLTDSLDQPVDRLG